MYTFEARRTYYAYDSKDRPISICESYNSGVKTSLQYVYENDSDEPRLAFKTTCHPHGDKKYTLSDLSEFIYRKDGKIVSELIESTYKYHLYDVKAEAVLDIINDQAKTAEESIFKDLKKIIAEIAKKIDIYDEIIINYQINSKDFDQLFKDSFDVIPENKLITWIKFFKKNANYKVYYEKGLVYNLSKFPEPSNTTYITEKSFEKENFIADKVEILYFPDTGDYTFFAIKPNQISSNNIFANYSIQIDYRYGQQKKYTCQTNVYEINGQIYTLQLMISGDTVIGIIDRVEKIIDDFYINMDRVKFYTDKKGITHQEVYHVINKVINPAQTDPNEPAYAFYYICTTDPVNNKHKARKFHKIYNMEYKKIDAIWPMIGTGLEQYHFYKYYEEKISEYSKKITVTEYWSPSLKTDAKTSSVRVTETIMVHDKPKEKKLLVDGEIKTYIYYNYSKDGKRLESKTQVNF